MDINLNYSDDESPLTLKSDFILSLCELIVGGKEGLQPVEKSIIDRCVRLIYVDYLADPIPEKVPILGIYMMHLKIRKKKRQGILDLPLKSMLQAHLMYLIIGPM